MKRREFSAGAACLVGAVALGLPGFAFAQRRPETTDPVERHPLRFTPATMAGVNRSGTRACRCRTTTRREDGGTDGSASLQAAADTKTGRG